MKIHFITGILDAGKSTYINEVLENDRSYKRVGGTTLLLLCEEGEFEFSRKLLKKHRVTVEVIGQEPDDPAAYFYELIARHKPGQVYIEWNSMWEASPAHIVEALDPDSYTVFVDGTTLDVYFNNMRQIFMRMIQPADVVVFNRVADRDSLEQYSQAFRLMNDDAVYLWQSPMGYHEQAFEEQLPYDKTQQLIPLDEDSYLAFCLDAHDHVAEYLDKEVEMVFETAAGGELGADLFFAGRRMMVCCENDVQMIGFYCDKGEFPLPKDFTFIKMKAKVIKAYGVSASAGIMLLAEEITPAAPPKNLVIQ